MTLAIDLVALGASAEQLAIKAYNTEAGLAHNRVKRIVQDSHGFLWFCTADGLSRFDGYQFLNYRFDDGLPAPSINDVIEASDGVYWVATNSTGVVRFDLTRAAGPDLRSRFSTYPISAEPVTNRVNVLYRDHTGALWAGTDGGLFRLAAGDKTFQPVPLGIPSRPDIQVQVWALVEHGAGDLWIGAKAGLVRRGADGRMTHYAIRPTGDDDTVSSLLFDAKGRLWIGHRSGLITFVPANATSDAGGGAAQHLPPDARRYTTRDGLNKDDVLAVHQSADGSIWVRTLGPGLTRFDGTAFRTYLVGAGAADDVASVTEDRDGNLWMGTNAGGALKIATHPWTTYREADGLGESVSAILENSAGQLYVTSSGWKVSRFDGGRFTTIRLPLPSTVTDESWRSVSGILQDHAGDWWVGTRQGLYRFGRVDRFEALAHARPTFVYTTRDGLPSDDVTRVFEDPKGDIWIASWRPERNVLARWERATARFHIYGPGDGLPTFKTVSTLAADAAGNVWTGFREGGLARYRNGTFSILGPEDGVRGGVNGMYVDPSQRLWIAVSGAGLCSIEHPDAERPAVVNYTTADGLTTNIVHDVTGDPAGRIYVTSSRGIDRILPQTRRVNHYSADDGLAGSEFTAALRDRTSTLWFATTTGLSRLVRDEEGSPADPPILISSLRIDGIAWPLSPLGEVSISPFELQPGQNNLQVEFFGMAFKSGEVLRYQFRLDGAETDWSVPSVQRSVNYANLAPGTYRFAVRAVSSEGTRSTSPATISFTILPPVWRRWWFVASFAIVATAVVVTVARSRYERVRALRKSREERLAELERVRKRIATDLHDDVGSSLTRISLLSEVVRRATGVEKGPVAENLESIAGLSRELVDAMSDIVWAVDPTKDHFSDLSQRMRRYISDVCTARQIEFRFDTPANERDLNLGANIRREVFLLFKEGVANMVRHSGCSKAALEFRQGDGELLLRIADNGRGFNPAAASEGHGLRSMQERAGALGGHFEAETAPGRGTILTFRIPVVESSAAAASAGTSGAAT